MRFLIGLAVGLALGFAIYTLLEPVRQQEVRRRLRAVLQERELEGLQASLRERMENLAQTAREAWREAQEVGRRAEQEMVSRYRQMRRTSLRRY
jgi:uncharacterized protein HemX